jgi:hypothetical protein
MDANGTKEGTMTAWQTTYDENLESALREYAAKWIERGSTARAEFAEKVAAAGGWSSQGPFGYRVAWDAEKIIEAETYEHIGHQLLELLNREEKDVSASKALEMARKHCRQMIGEGLSANSTGRFHNGVAQAIGVAALAIEDRGLDEPMISAHFQTRRELLSDEDQIVRNAKNVVQELQRKLDRARTNESLEKLERQLFNARDELIGAETTLAHREEEFGVPAL